MNPGFTLQVERDLVMINHLLFTELVVAKDPDARSAWRDMLINTLPSIVQAAKTEDANYRLHIPKYFADRLLHYADQDEKLRRIVSQYSQSKLISAFTSSSFFPDEQDPQGDFTVKEEVHFYKTYVQSMRRQNSRKQVTILTSHSHAQLVADRLINAGVSRVIGFSPEEGFVEYKVCEPKTGDIVFYEGKEIRLGDFIAKGGEATIFELGSDFVAKVYGTGLDEQTLMPNCVKFQEQMKQRSARLTTFFDDPRYRIDDPRLIFPLAPLTDPAGEIVGVVMRRVRGRELFSIINNRAWPFKGFNRIELIQIAKEIADQVKVIHDHGILIGDINMRNIFVDASGPDDINVYLIDLDGCQIEGHPSTYETVGYRDPLWDLESGRPREPKNEVFTLLVLLFEVLHMAHPYTWTGGRGRETTVNWQESMEKRHFPYLKGVRPPGKDFMSAPVKSRFIYSHLDNTIADLFTRTFGELDYRPDITTVIECLESYQQFVKRYEASENELEYINFKIQPFDRIVYHCSNKNCTHSEYYAHAGHIIEQRQKKIKHLFCHECLEKHKDIMALIRKSTDEEEKNELRQYWFSQLDEQNIDELLEQFYSNNPTHKTKADWEATKAKLAQEEARRAIREHRTQNIRNSSSYKQANVLKENGKRASVHPPSSSNKIRITPSPQASRNSQAQRPSASPHTAGTPPQKSSLWQLFGSFFK